MKKDYKNWQDYPGPARDLIWSTDPDFISYIDPQHALKLDLVLKRLNYNILLLLLEKKNTIERARRTADMPELRLSVSSLHPMVINIENQQYTQQIVQEELRSIRERFSPSELKFINPFLKFPSISVPSETKYFTPKQFPSASETRYFTPKQFPSYSSSKRKKRSRRSSSSKTSMS
uniref:Uncharacterized protein n=1 Tax=viral metagenome TaxID=1070528 RepID=A0A6C0E1L5_9ZZZZ